jgi:hypothetical protein
MGLCELAVWIKHRFIRQTRRLLHDRKFSKSWDADFCYMQQSKQPSNF